MWPTPLLLWLALSHQPPRKAPPRRRPAFRRPRLEALEDRCLLSSYSITELGAIASLPAYGGSGIHNAAVVQVVGQSAAGPGASVRDSTHGVQPAMQPAPAAAYSQPVATAMDPVNHRNHHCRFTGYC
jgi:hypothetical protein